MYCTVTDVRAVLSATGESDTATAASLPTDILQRAVDEARAEVDARLGARYDVPFDDPRLGDNVPVPMVVRNITRDIAAYKATLTFRRGAQIESTDPTVLRFNDASRLLTSLVNGSATLGLQNSPPPQAAQASNGQPINRYPGPLFTERELGLGPSFGRYPGGDLGETY